MKSNLEQYLNERFADWEIPFSDLPDDVKKGIENTYAFYFWKFQKRFSELKQAILKSIHLN